LRDDAPDSHGAGDDLPPRDHVGCLLVALRTGCGMALLWILMGLAILAAALLSLLIFR
jgi:hypothetical protein